MTGRLAAAILLAVAVVAQPVTASAASPSPSACPVASASPIAPTPKATPDPALVELCREQQQLAQTRTTLNSNLQAALNAEQALQQSLDANAKQQADVRGLIAQSDSKIAALDDDIQKLNQQIDETRRRIVRERQELLAAELELYRMPSSTLLVVMQAGSLREAILDIGDIAAVGAHADQVKRSLQSDEARLDAQLAKQRQDRAEQVSVRQERQGQLAQLEQLRKDQEATGSKLSAKIQATRAELQTVDSQSAARAKQISQALEAEQVALIGASVQQAWEQTEAWLKANPVGSQAISAGHSHQYRFIWPEPQGVVVQGFGPTDFALEPAYGGFAHFHTGIDLVEPELSPILAADDGEVAAVGAGTTGYGNYVVVAHAGGLTTLYGHLSQAVVKVGDQVVQGQPIGLEGSTGNSTGPHLHFELRVGGIPVDPSLALPPGAPSGFKG